jgi:hypothetical protein
VPSKDLLPDISRGAPPNRTDHVPAELLDEVADPLLWFDLGPARAPRVLHGANAAARTLVAAQRGSAAEEALSPLGPALWRWFSVLGPDRSEALLEGGEAGTLRAVSWLAGGLRVLRLHALAAPLATRISDAAPGTVVGGPAVPPTPPTRVDGSPEAPATVVVDDAAPPATPTETASAS